MICHAHAYEYAYGVTEMLELRRGDIYYAPLPLFHLAGQFAVIYASCIAVSYTHLTLPTILLV